MGRLLRYGGVVASVILIAIGLASVYMGVDGRSTVRGDLAREQIVGTPDSSIPGQKVDSGSEAKAFAAVMRKHTLEATGGQTYSQMGRFLDDNGKATEDEAAAAKDPKTGQPVENAAQHLDQLDRLPNRAEHRVLRRKRRHLRARHRHRAGPGRDRAAHLDRPPARPPRAARRRRARPQHRPRRRLNQPPRHPSTARPSGRPTRAGRIRVP